jgi:hypothetical protein
MTNVLKASLLVAAFAATVVIACSHAHAAEKTMPIDFVGDWCSPSRERATENAA